MVNKRKVDTLIISDIHLGFRFSRTEALLDMLKKYDFEQLIINGDIFDNLDLTNLNTDHWKVLSYFRELSKNKKVIWVIGNHDGTPELLSNLIGVKVFKHFIWEIEGRKFLAIHGHQFDRYIHKNLFLGRLASALYYFIKKFELYNKSTAISNWIKKNNRGWLRMSDDVAKGAVMYSRIKQCNYVFCGHTHISMHKRFKKVHYYNSGSWIESPAEYITITGLDIEIHKVK